MAFTIIAAVLAGLTSVATPPGDTAAGANAGTSETPVVLIARTGVSLGDEVAPEEVVGSLAAEEDEFGLPTRLGGPLPNYKCKDYANGCPAGSTYLDSNGNVVGCNSGCTGECTYCEGGVVGVRICKKTAGQECSLEDVVASEWCGYAAPGRCITAIGPGGGDNNGCWCVKRGEYTEASCQFVPCSAPI